MTTMLGVCVQVWASGQASAAPASSRDGWVTGGNRKTARIGVSAVVLPKCGVRVGSASAEGWVRPVEVRCTQDTNYGLGVETAAGPEMSIRQAAAQSPEARTAVGRGDGQPTMFVVQRSRISKQQVVLDGELVTILSVDF